jgi:NAD+ diphosphatase
MIGCIAKATSYEVLLNASEMEDVQWYDRAELAAAVTMYDQALPLQEVQKRSWATLGFFVPPPFAIAHHIMRAWALNETGSSFFAATPPASAINDPGAGGSLDPTASEELAA